MAKKQRGGVTGGAASTAAKGTAAGIPAAKTFAPSGAPEQRTDVDPTHPALDANPRAGTTELQNRIDLNDPSLSGSEAVEANLKKQS